MLCMCAHTSTHTLQIALTILSLQCFTQAEKSSCSTCMTDSEVPGSTSGTFAWGKNLGFFPSYFLPSLLSKHRASVEHTAAEAVEGRNLGASSVLLFLNVMPGSWLRSAHCKEGSADMSCHINVNNFGWLQMRSQGVSGCFRGWLLQLRGSVADKREVLAGADQLPWAQGVAQTPMWGMVSGGKEGKGLKR